MEKGLPNCRQKTPRKTWTEYNKFHPMFCKSFRNSFTKHKPLMRRTCTEHIMRSVPLNPSRSALVGKKLCIFLLIVICAISLPNHVTCFTDELEEGLSALSKTGPEFQRNLAGIRSPNFERTKSLRRTPRSTEKETWANFYNLSMFLQANNTGLSEFGSDSGLGIDYPFSLDYDILPSDYVSKFYVGPVCTIVDVRNTPDDLKDLENCTIVNGFVQILFMHSTTEKDFEKYSFPKLRVITEYLLIYRVYGLRSLRKLFPNLAVIEGRKVFYNYGMVIYDNPQMQELGLGNLRHMSRGGVRIQKNINLCYLDTVDWNRLGRFGKEVVNRDMSLSVIKDNASPEEANCLYQCGEDGECASNELDGYGQNCWGLKICQKPSCPTECPYACTNGECNCHKECLGGCTAPNNASACLACRNVYNNETCVDKCPDGKYLKDDFHCVTSDWCAEVQWLKHESLCVRDCPVNYMREGDHCAHCGGRCVDVCDGYAEYIVQDMSGIRDVYGCTSIPGRLVINLSGRADLQKSLEEALLGLEEIGSLVVRRSESLVSLSFLKNLKRITGAREALKDETYSLYVLDNQNLQQLFPVLNDSVIHDSGKSGERENHLQNQLRIEGGKTFFHFNPKLCMREIEKVSSLTALTEDDMDISEITNGDRVTCDMMPLIIEEIGHMPITRGNEATVRVKWKNIEISDPRTLIGYQVFYKESKLKNATRFEGVYACGRSSSWFIKDKLVNPNQDYESGSTQVILHDLKPFTQYAIYVRTYMTSMAKKGAQSKMTYFTTEPSKPSEPVEVRALALNTSSILVEWEPPYFPNGNITHYQISWRKQRENEELARRVDLCKSRDRYNPPLPTVITPDIDAFTKESEMREKKCCSCEDGTSLTKRQEIANDNLNFEKYLHKTMLQVYYYPSFRSPYDHDDDYRRRRSLGSVVTEGEIDAYLNDTEIDTYKSEEDTDEDIFPIAPEDDDNDEYSWNVATASETRILLSNLRHYSSYEIQVTVCNHASNFMAEDFSKVGCSIASLTSMRTHLLPSADNIPEKTFVSTTIESKNTANDLPQPALTWSLPPDPNGFIKYFTLQMERKEATTYTPTDDQCWSIGEFEKQKGLYRIPEYLSPGEYRVRILPVSLGGKGEWTDYVSFTIERPIITPEPASHKTISIAAVVGGTMCILIASALVWYYRKKRYAESKNAMIYSSANPDYVSFASNYTPDEYEVDEKDVELLQEIGQGNFGKVFVGYAKNVIKGENKTMVAIKKLHAGSGIYKRIEFLDEAKMMKAFDTAHVVRLLGVVSQTTDPLVIMEFMQKGDLKSFLRNRRVDADVDKDIKLPPPTLQEKLQMAAEIADGMAYLTAIKYIHRDLAARNCLVHASGSVKIGDFGLTRDVYEMDYYRKGSRGLLPIRWMAPESLKDGVFTYRSDVWSYGVVLWELATLAEQPYQGQPHDQVTRYVIDGGYMEKPQGCPKKLYDLMLNCWQYSANMRPTFMEILSLLSPDVDDRFQKESYYFRQKTLQSEEFHNDEESALLNGVITQGKEPPRKGFGTPINVTPCRSRSGTPCSCHTPSRNSNSSTKLIISEEEPSRTGSDGPPFPVYTYNGHVPGMSNTDGLLLNRGSSFIRTVENSSVKGSRNSSPRMKKSFSLIPKRKGDDAYYSVNSSGIEADFDGGDSESLTENENLNGKREGEAAVTEIERERNESNKRATDRHTHENGFAHGALAPGSDVIHLRKSPSQVCKGDRACNDLKPSKDDKPYAHMNGFLSRHNSHTGRLSPRRNHSRNFSQEETGYVETSPQLNAKYFESNSSPNSHFTPLSGKPPSPPSIPAPLPPSVQPLIQP